MVPQQAMGMQFYSQKNFLDKYSDSEGRLLMVKCCIEKTFYIHINSYAPTQQHKNDQINFIKMTKHRVNKFKDENIIIAGDFNFYMNPKLDKLETITHKHDNNIYQLEIETIIECLNLNDVGEH